MTSKRFHSGLLRNVNSLFCWKSFLSFYLFICFAPLSSLTSSVPTDALANKLFGAPEPTSIARSLPTTVPDSPNYRSARTPRTPRTPHRKDPTMTPRFYPVVKESRPVDAKVRRLPSESHLLGWKCVRLVLRFYLNICSQSLTAQVLSTRLYKSVLSFFRHPGKGRPDTAPTHPWSATLAGWWTPESIAHAPPPSGETHSSGLCNVSLKSLWTEPKLILGIKHYKISLFGQKKMQL